MTIIENKIKQIEELKTACASFEAALNDCKTVCGNALKEFDNVQGKTLNAIAKQYKKRVTAALKALNGETRKKAVNE